MTNVTFDRARDGAHGVSFGRKVAPPTTGSPLRGCQWEPRSLAFAASLSTLSATSSFAYTAEAQQMCTGDAFRLCSAEIPNISKITTCMIKHRSELSPAAAR